jgi:hypothetical protein
VIEHGVKAQAADPFEAFLTRGDRFLHRIKFGPRVDHGQELGFVGKAIDPVSAVGAGAAGEYSLRQRVNAVEGSALAGNGFRRVDASTRAKLTTVRPARVVTSANLDLDTREGMAQVIIDLTVDGCCRAEVQVAGDRLGLIERIGDVCAGFGVASRRTRSRTIAAYFVPCEAKARRRSSDLESTFLGGQQRTRVGFPDRELHPACNEAAVRTGDHGGQHRGFTTGQPVVSVDDMNRCASNRLAGQIGRVARDL